MIDVLTAVVLGAIPLGAPSAHHLEWHAGQGLSFSAIAGHIQSQPLVLGPTRVQRSGKTFAVGSGGPAPVVEETSTHGASTEVRWHFARAPQATGPLEVALPAAGLLYAGASPRGLHFLDPSSSLYVGVSAGTWVDAAGKRTPVPVRFEGGEVRWAVDAETLARTLWPAVLDPILTPEVGFDVPVLGPASEEQLSPRAANGPGSTFVVWSDARGGDFECEVWGAVLTPSGTGFTSSPVRIATGNQCERTPVVAYGQGRFLVIWHDASAGGVVGRFYETDGRASGPRFPLAFHDGHQLDVAFDGVNFVVVWKEMFATPSYDIHLIEVTPSGALGPDLVVTQAAGGQYQPGIACDGSRHCLVVWEDDRDFATNSTDIWGARIDSGAVVEPDGFPIDRALETQRFPSVAWAGANWLVTWYEENGLRDTGAQRVGSDGVLIGPPFPLLTGSGDQNEARVVASGTGFLVAFRQNGELRAQRFNDTGAPVDQVPAAFCPRCSNWTTEEPAAAAGGLSPPLVVWRDYRWGTKDVYGVHLNSSLEPVEDGGFPVAVSSGGQRRPKIATDGTGYLAVWLDDGTEGRAHVVGALVDASGNPVSQTGEVISFNDPNDKAQYPTAAADVAFGGGKYLVVWEGKAYTGKTTLFGRTYVPGAGLGEAGPFFLSDAGSPDESRPAVGSSAGQFLVAYDQDNDVYARRVPFSGAALDPDGILVASTADDQDTWAVRGVGDDFVVAWHREETNFFSSHLGRVTAAGATPDGPDGVSVGVSWARSGYSPALACHSQGCLITYESQSDIFGRLYDAQLAPRSANPIFISRGSNGQNSPAVTWQQGRYLVAWEDRRSGQLIELYSSEVADDGTVSPEAGRLLATGDTSVKEPALASVGPGRALLAYTRLDVSPNVNASRVRVRAVLEQPDGTGCTEASHCVSGFCVDGVCCDSACGGGARDCQACSVASGAAVDGQCVLLAAQAVCRSAVSVCDVAERCDGAQVACPGDGFNPEGAACNIDGACVQGLCIGGQSGPAGFTTTPGVFLTCSETFRYNAAGRPEVNGPGQVVYSLAPLPGEALPEGLEVNSDTGELNWTPTREQAGQYHPVLIARGAGWAAAQTLELDVECVPRKLGVTCAAAAGPAWPALLLLLAVGLRRGRRPGRSGG